jgi:anti-sigma regulatory factor (Ser/Thr protein kinase)
MNATSSHPETTSVDGPTLFRRHRLRADASTVGQARIEFARWLQDRLGLTTACRTDLVLAVNEALANAAEHAYASDSDIGSMDVDAHYDAARDTLTVSVEDHGRWRATRPDTAPRTRGRGIRLMRELANDIVINTTAAGTRVNMTWRRVHVQHT